MKRSSRRALRSSLKLPFILAFGACVVVAVYAGAAIGGTSRTSASPASSTSKITATITASATTLSGARVPAGTVVFTLVNKDKAPHTLVVAGQKSPAVAGGKRATWNITLDKPGRYNYKGTSKGPFAVTAASADYAKLIAAAKKEGTLTWYTAIPTSTSQPFADAFTAKYGIKVELFNSSTVADRYAAERDANTVLADVVNSTDPAFFDDGTAKGWFVTLTPALVPNIAVIPGKFFRLHTYAVISIQSVGIAYNKNLVGANPPTSWEDLLDPKYDGHILLTDPSLIIPWLCTYKLWQDKLAPGFLTKLAAQHPTFVSSSNPGAQQIAAGEKWINVPSSPRALVAVLAAGAPIGYVIPKPTTIQESTEAISTAAKHPNAARLFMDYTLSPEGQAQLNKDTAISVLPNIPGTLSMPDDYVLPDAIGAQRQKAQLLAPFGRS